MGHNRAGVRQRARLRRHKREVNRLARKAEETAAALSADSALRHHYLGF